MEPRHYRRVRSRAIEAAEAENPRGRDWSKPIKVAAVVGAAALLVGFFVSRVLPRDGEGSISAGEGVIQAEVALDGSGDEKQAAIDLVKRFLLAGSVEEMLALVAHPEETEPRMREFFVEGGRNQLPMGGKMVGLQSKDMQEKMVYRLLVERMFASSSLVIVEPDGEDVLKILWEETVGWMDPDWEEVLEAKPEEPVLVRVVAAVDDYYNYDYRDEDRWICMRLSDRRLEHPCYAYIQKSDPRAGKLAENVGYLPVSLEIKFSPGQKRDQAEIVRFLAVGWKGE